MPTVAMMNISLPLIGAGFVRRSIASTTSPPVITHTIRIDTRAPIVSARWYPNEYDADASIPISRMQYADTTKENTSENMWAASDMIAMLHSKT
jgi:hypothetical protein